jgi:hypothetical protein
MTVLQIVITRTPQGGFKINEMGLGPTGLGETLRTHDLQPEISPDMATRYLANVMRELVAVEEGKS